MVNESNIVTTGVVHILFRGEIRGKWSVGIDCVNASKSSMIRIVVTEGTLGHGRLVWGTG